jgi:glycine oxidase
MATVDVTVRGAGVFGLSVAWACILRGARVRVVDPFGPGAGSSGGIVGALAPHVPEQWNDKKAFQLQALVMAADWWGGVENAGGVDPGYARTGRLQPLADAAAVSLAKARGDGASDLWPDDVVWVVEPTADHAGWLSDTPSGLCIRDTLSARIHPRRAVAALVAAFRVRGGEVAGEAQDEGAVIWATGHAGLAEGPKPLGNGVKGQAALLAHDACDLPQLFVDGLHIVPHADGTVAIGSTSEREWDDPTATDAQLDALIARARAACPALADAPVVDRWAGIRPRAASRAPLLGVHPQRAGQFIANGGFKIGFGVAPMVGQVMADLVLDGRDTIPPGFTYQTMG